MSTAYLAPEGLLEPVIAEIGKKHQLFGRLVVTAEPPKRCFWAQNIWRDTRRFEFDSISEAAKMLRSVQRNWALYAHSSHRRARLIQESLPHVSSKPIVFPAPLPKAPLGSWTLLSPNEILYSIDCSSPFANGEPKFMENKTDPPSRAYLKLWEALTVLEAWPKKGDRCLDAGASPGGWTWALSELGADVTAIDRTALAPDLMRRRNVHFRKGDAFALTPESGERFDWIFSDVACYPEKLVDWLLPWMKSAPKTNFVCTMKFQGMASRVSDREGAIEKLAAVSGAWIGHLAANKHELTFTRIGRNAH